MERIVPVKLCAARPHDTRPLGARTLQIHDFELVPRTPEVRGFSLTFRIVQKFRGFYADFALIVFSQPHDAQFRDTRFFSKNQKPHNLRLCCI